MTLTIALVRETASEERMGRAMGLLGTVSALGTALGPSLGGVLVSATGWRSIFLVQVALAVLALSSPSLTCRATRVERAYSRPAFGRGRTSPLCPTYSSICSSPPS